MQKKDIQVGAIYNLKFYKTLQVPVRIVSVSTYKTEVEYLDSKTFLVRPVPNPPVYGAMTEFVPFSMISEYKAGN